MIAAAQQDIVIDMEETPIVNTEVGNTAYGSRAYCFTSATQWDVFFFAPMVQLKAEKVRSELTVDS